MPDATQELVENQHDDQFHINEQTGVKTPIRDWLSDEVERIEGAVNEDVERAKAAVEAEAEKIRAAAEEEIEALKAKIAELEKSAKPAAKKAAATKAAAAPETAVRETGEVKN